MRRAGRRAAADRVRACWRTALLSRTASACACSPPAASRERAPRRRRRRSRALLAFMLSGVGAALGRPDRRRPARHRLSERGPGLRTRCHRRRGARRHIARRRARQRSPARSAAVLVLGVIAERPESAGGVGVRADAGQGAASSIAAIVAHRDAAAARASDLAHDDDTCTGIALAQRTGRTRLQVALGDSVRAGAPVSGRHRAVRRLSRAGLRRQHPAPSRAGRHRRDRRHAGHDPRRRRSFDRRHHLVRAPCSVRC